MHVVCYVKAKKVGLRTASHVVDIAPPLMGHYLLGGKCRPWWCVDMQYYYVIA